MTRAVEEWKSWIGKEGPVVHGHYEASKATIGYLCEASEDANPLYHDEDYARTSRYLGIICPPPMLLILGVPPSWQPRGERHSVVFALDVPIDCDMGVNIAVDVEFFAPVFPGDKVHFQSKITDIVPKTTRLGDGFFITEEVTYWNEKNEKVGVAVNLMYRYRRPQQ